MALRSRPFGAAGPWPFSKAVETGLWEGASTGRPSNREAVAEASLGHSEQARAVSRLARPQRSTPNSPAITAPRRRSPATPRKAPALMFRTSDCLAMAGGLQFSVALRAGLWHILRRSTLRSWTRQRRSCGRWGGFCAGRTSRRSAWRPTSPAGWQSWSMPSRRRRGHPFFAGPAGWAARQPTGCHACRPQKSLIG